MRPRLPLQYVGRLKAHISRTISRVLHLSGTARLNRRSSAIVLCYHNVVPDCLAGRVGDDSLHLAYSDFSEQIEWVASAFTVVPVGDLMKRLRAGRPVGGLAALTFDDGYAGAVQHAVPLLRKAGLPFALFPVVAAIERQRPFWWDRLRKLDSQRRERCLVALQGDDELIAPESVDPSAFPEELLPARWDMLRQVLGEDCTIGVHTVTHRNLSTLKPAEVTWELSHARERLNEELGVASDVVAYPYGSSNRVVQAEAERMGFAAGLGLDFGMVRSPASRFNIERIDVPEGIDTVTFACWASGLKLRDY